MRISLSRALLGAASVAAVWGMALAPAAAATTLTDRAAVIKTAPIDLGTQQIVDDAGVGADTSAAQEAIGRLRSDAHLGLFVAVVDSFDGVDKTTWADQSFTASDLGDNDILLAIAVQDRRFGYWVLDSFPLAKTQLDNILNNQVAPYLSSGDWSGAIVATADGLADGVSNGASAGDGSDAIGGGSGSGNATSSGSSNSGGSGVGWFIALLAVLGGGTGIFLWVRSSQRKKAAEAAENKGPQREPYQQLSDRSVAALIDTDNAVRGSESELSLAVGEFGEAATAEFTSAYNDAKAALTQAFTLRQQIDDEIPESEDIRRGWMKDILTFCGDARTALAAQSEKFETLRNLKARLPEVLAELPRTIDAELARLPQAAADMSRLRGAYAESALGTIAGNPDQASERLTFARQTTDEARKATAGGDSTNAVLGARAAQEAVKQAQDLLAAIGRLDTDLAAATSALATARQHVTQEVADVRAALAQGSAGARTEQINAQLDAVDRMLAQTAGADAARDPITSLKALTDADHRLDTVLADTRSAQQHEAQARASLDRELMTAKSTISTVEGFISTRRGAVGSEARTRIAEAKRYLDQAESLAATDAAGALAAAQRASELADKASYEVDRDMNQWGGGMGSGGGSPMRGVGGAILGGILINSIFGGGRGGGFGGGWGGGGGGFSGGGFGGGGGGGGGFGGGGSF